MDQMHREPVAEVLDHAESGGMLPYEEVFPADWDLLVVHEARTCWAIDHHCLNPICTCAELVVERQCIDTPKAEYAGQARLDLHRRGGAPEASTPLAAKLFVKLWTREQDALVRRRQEVARPSAGTRLATMNAE